MHADTDGPDAADDRTAAASSITYCRAVLWIKPLLAVIEKGNNNRWYKADRAGKEKLGMARP